MNIEIVENVKERRKEDNAYIKEVLSGKVPVDKQRAKKTIIITPEVFAKIFSPERIKLILRIKQKEQKNIYQLAKALNRKYEAVHRDIKLLEGFGIISVQEKDRERIPSVEEPITIPMLAAS